VRIGVYLRVVLQALHGGIIELLRASGKDELARGSVQEKRFRVGLRAFELE
jgi:hypothetical protein